MLACMRKYQTNYGKIIYSSRIRNDEELLSVRNNLGKKKTNETLNWTKNAILLTDMWHYIHIFPQML